MNLFGKSLNQWGDFLRENLLKNKFNRDVIWNLASLMILAAGGFVINLVIARFRGDVALGVFNQVFAFYTIASQFSVGGMHLSVLKEISYHQDNRQDCSEIMTAGLFLVAILAAVVSLSGYLLSHQIGLLLQSVQVEYALRLAMPGLLVFSINKVLMSTLNGLRYMRTYAVFQALRYILLASTVVFFVFIGFPSTIFALALTTTEVILFICLFPYLATRLHLLRGVVSMSRWFTTHISFGIRGFMSGTLNEMNSRLDVLLLGIFASDAQVGIYSFASTLAGGFIQLPMVLRWNLDPIIGAYFAKNEASLITGVARKVRRYFYPIMILVCLLVVLSYPLVFGLLLRKPDIATASWGVFAILIAGVLVSARCRPFYGILLQGGRPGVHTFMLATLFFTGALLCLILIPLWGIYGAALSIALMYSLEATLLFYNARKYFGVRL